MRYLRLTGRGDEHVALVEAYAKQQGLWHDPDFPLAYSAHVELDLSTVVPSLAGPRRPQDRVPLTSAQAAFRTEIRADALHAHASVSWVDEASRESFPASDAPAIEPELRVEPPEDEDEPESADAAESEPAVEVRFDGQRHQLGHGAVAIASITSCTNTSNPRVMVGAGLLARNAVRRGLMRRPWVKTTLSPGSLVVMDYLRAAGLVESLEAIGFHLAGFGCMTCIGASGPLIDELAAAVHDHHLAVVSVLSGNRNFEGRIHPEVKLNYLASPPLVVAYALAGTMDIDLVNDPLGYDSDRRAVFLSDIWPSAEEIEHVIERSMDADMFRRAYTGIFDGDHRWQGLDAPTGTTFAWDPASTYVRRPPHLDGMPAQPPPIADIIDARVLVKLGDSITTDHVSPAGAITRDSYAGRYLASLGVAPREFNTFASRRGNHEVMARGAFANVRLRNHLVSGTVGGFTRCFDAGGAVLPMYEAAQIYKDHNTPVVVIAGQDYGAGSSRDWAAKGPRLLGIRAVLAESFERIHRANLIGMGILPLQFLPGESADSLGLTGEETITIRGLASALADGSHRQVDVHADTTTFAMRVRLDTAREADYFHHGGVMPYVLRTRLTTAHR